jgi:hypothetical protein
MKQGIKLFMVLTAVLVLISLALVPAFALAAPLCAPDGVEAIQSSSGTELFDLASLGTLAGVVAAVSLMVQICKYLLPFNLNPKIYCLVWSAIFTAARLLWVIPPTSPADYFAAGVNLLIIAVAATGTFEFAIKPLQGNLLKMPGANTNPGSSDDAQ